MMCPVCHKNLTFLTRVEDERKNIYECKDSACAIFTVHVYYK